MNWKEMNKKAVMLLIKGKVRKEMESVRFGEQYTVGDEEKYYHVDVLTKSGGNILTCDCMNSLCNKNGSICSHKIAVIMYAQRNEVFS